jgi:hypothetical protein
MEQMTTSTILAITGIELGNYSCRNLTQDLAHLDQASQVLRTINGRAVDFSSPQFRKFSSKISCNDQEAPELVDVWPGLEITVLTLSQLTGPDAVYLTMLVTSWKVTRDEWGSQTSWEMELVEK